MFCHYYFSAFTEYTRCFAYGFFDFTRFVCSLMDFGRKILSKYGWKDGDGLGKFNDGIAKPLRATLKFDNAGFGADQAAADFNNHWWERVFNEAASNVSVKQEGEKIKISLKNIDNGVEISTKGYSMKKLQNAKRKRGNDSEVDCGYDNFLKSTTLNNFGNEVENPDKICNSDIEFPKVKVLADEELFKACGGRTAHKGARHGLKLSGKLSRIEQQEAKLLAEMMAKRKGSNEYENRMILSGENKIKLKKLGIEPKLQKPKKRRGVANEALTEKCNTDKVKSKISKKRKPK